MIISGKIKNKNALSLFGCFISLSIITMTCFFPFPHQSELIDDIISNNEGVLNNYIPFHTIYTSFVDAIKYHVYQPLLYSIIGNIVLFIPLGFFLSLGIENKIRILGCICFSSFSIEMFQYFFNSILEFNYRSVDIDDFVLNVCGGIIGYIMVYFINEKIKKRKINLC
ncbi:MAG: VanZ family protein [Clostridia bacterium]|nr:VanZ family protein [Clostridia bacterium]